MKLELLDIDKFIQSKQIMQVKTYRIPSKNYDEDGLWSEIIFGPVNSKVRLERFGYIDLKRKFIHPSVFDMLITVSNSTSKIVRNKDYFSIEDEKYIEDKDGRTGIEYLIETAKQVKYSKFCHSHKKDIAKYLDETNFLIDKFLVLPAGLRDINIYDKEAKIKIDEINNLYIKLMIYIQQLTGFNEIDEITIRKIQLQLNEISDNIKNTKMKGKQGLFRGTMLRKTLDYSSRLILNNDPDIPLGKIGLPWHTLLSIYEPFVIHHIFTKNDENTIKILKEYSKYNDLNINNFSKLNREICDNPDVVPLEVKTTLINVLNKFISNQIVMVKRDPVQQRNSWFSAIPIITEGRAAYVNSLDLGPIGGDSDGDTVAIMPVFTEEGKKEALSMNPAYTKSKWKSIISYNSIIYTPSLDAISIIYRATKDEHKKDSI